MPDKRTVGVAVTGLAMMTLAACSSTATGQAVPTTGSASGSTGISLPQRPTTISMNGVDPCKLLTAAQQAQFQVQSGVPAHLAHGETGAVCAFNFPDVSSTGGYDVSAITSPGIEHWLNSNLIATVKQTTVAGFPAVNVIGQGQDTGCITSVSVAEGQVLEIDNGLIAKGLTSAQSCEKTNAVAEAAMATLQTLK